MDAKHEGEVGLNNSLLFRRHQREDGRLPGSICLKDGQVVAEFNKFQGFCFPAPALNMYYLAKPGDEYLHTLYSSLEGFDAYLWCVRATGQDGVLASFSAYANGEDNALR